MDSMSNAGDQRRRFSAGSGSDFNSSLLFCVFAKII